MQNTQQIGQIRREYIIAQSFAYLFASIFLLTITGTRAEVAVSHFFGAVFMLAAVIMVISPFSRVLFSMGAKTNKIATFRTFLCNVWASYQNMARKLGRGEWLGCLDCMGRRITLVPVIFKSRNIQCFSAFAIYGATAWRKEHMG